MNMESDEFETLNTEEFMSESDIHRTLSKSEEDSLLYGNFDESDKTTTTSTDPIDKPNSESTVSTEKETESTDKTDDTGETEDTDTNTTQPVSDSLTQETTDTVTTETENEQVDSTTNEELDQNDGNSTSQSTDPGGVAAESENQIAPTEQTDHEKRNSIDSVEENMKALQSDEVTNSNEEPTEFVHVNSNNSTSKDKSNNLESQDEPMEACEDPIGGTDEAESVDYEESNDKTETSQEKDIREEPDNNPDESQESTKSSRATPAANTKKGADEALCIIPDTERVISQEEKDAATAQKSSKKLEMDNSTTIQRTTDRANVENGEDSEVDSAKETNHESEEKNGEVTDVNSVSNDKPEGGSRIRVRSDTMDVSRKSKEDTYDPDNLVKLEEEIEKTCRQCCMLRDCSYKYNGANDELYFCKEVCLKSYFNITDRNSGSKPASNKFKISRDKNTMREPLVFVRKCHECKKEVVGDERNLTWECMEFCNEDCLAKFQTAIGGSCANCKDNVPLPSLGKYCVRFGYDIRQFCSSSCLEDFKKGLKVCSYCQKDISGGVEGFLAPVGDKGQFKDFCTQSCMEKYDQMNANHAVKKQIAQCDVCSNEKLIRLEIEVEDVIHKLCSEPCFVAFKFANNVSPEQCKMCQKYFEQTTLDYTIYFDGQPNNFCCKTCQNVYIISNRKIVPCHWCKVKKYNFDMIKKTCLNGQVLMMCSINCLALYQVSINAVSARKIKCDQCATMNQPQYHLTMSDASMRNFCSYQCVMTFQNQFPKSPITIATSTAEKINTRAVPTGQPKRTYSRQTRSSATSNDKLQPPPPSTSPSMPIITSVHSLAQPQTNGPSTVTRSSSKSSISSTLPSLSSISLQTPPQVVQNVVTQTVQQPPPQQLKPKFIQQIIVKPAAVPEIKNKSTMCKPNMHTKGVSFKPHVSTKETQTDDSLAKTVIVPVPVPIYVPTPMSLFSIPFPVPTPFPLPVPIPIFIPTTRNSANGIMKEIKKIQVKIPTDPFEAELLMMAEMVAGDKKVENTDSESEEEDTAANEGGFSPEAVDTSNTFGDDMLQMALKMATELDEPAVDLEGALTANTITASQSHDGGEDEEDNQQLHHHAMMEARGGGRGRKRQARTSRGGATGKRGRRMSGHEGMPMMPPPQQAAPQPPPEPVEKPDANMCLKYTFGVNAWKQWVTTKNAELEKSTLPIKPFKSEILQLTADELNYSLCLFVKEVRKPNGSEYAPDTIYYLCLGIQQYLFENGRIDNIFTDAFYEKFTECLDEVARKFSVLYNDSHYIVTRVEEEHLWESKQLGAHSPHVLLSTLMFFNTKHFNLTTVDEHMQLSFSHIMKHWKRNPNQPGASKGPGSRNVLLRFYPPQNALGDSADANARKKKVYEQQENEENPLRCPVKLYEFYLSKCPESVKTRNDVFYLLPERSCVPDSPVWYSTMPLGRNALEKMLHRVKMVKEINVALLTS